MPARSVAPASPQLSLGSPAHRLALTTGAGRNRRHQQRPRPATLANEQTLRATTEPDVRWL